MSRFCQITKKKSIVGYTVSHSNNKTKRRFNINLFNKRIFFSQKKTWIKLKISAVGIKIIDAIGIKKALHIK